MDEIAEEERLEQKAYLEHKDLMKGGHLFLESLKSNRQYGTTVYNDMI